MDGPGAAASYGDLLITSLVVLVGVCIAAFVVVKLVGRFLATGRVRGAHLLDVIARLPLEPRRSLYVVEVAGKTLLVGTSEMGALGPLGARWERGPRARGTAAELRGARACGVGADARRCRGGHGGAGCTAARRRGASSRDT